MGLVWNSTYDSPRLLQICLIFIKPVKLFLIYTLLFNVDVFQTTSIGTNPLKGQTVLTWDWKHACEFGERQKRSRLGVVVELDQLSKS